MKGQVTLVGTGLIGRGWAILFANSGYTVVLYDKSREATELAFHAIAENLRLMETEELVSDADEVLSRIRTAATLEQAVEDAFYIQESVPEDVAIKKGVFRALGQMTREHVILASSCSTIPPGEFMEGVLEPERCVIVHPFSPPHLVPLVEIVRSQHTSPTVARRASELMREIGQKPVLINKPVVGFVVNRLQAVVINEALRLVRDEVISPEDLDLCMSHGLGTRWAFMGPFETMDLNAPDGFADYIGRYEDVYRSILHDVDMDFSWRGSAMDCVEQWRRQQVPDRAGITRRRLWRDQMLMRMKQLLGSCDGMKR